jgi:hypothetical protein
MADLRLDEPMDLCACIGDRFVASEATNRKQKLEGQAVSIKKPRVQELNTLSGLLVKKACPDTISDRKETAVQVFLVSTERFLS